MSLYTALMTEIKSTRCKTCETYRSQTKTKSVAAYLNALDTGEHWPATDLKFYFYSTSDGSTVLDGYSETIRNWTDVQKDNFRFALNAWAEVSAFTFTEVFTTGEADMRLFLIDDNSYPYLGHAYFPGSTYKGQVYVSYNNASDTDFPVGSYDWITMIHELGHSLGLAHPHDTGGSSTIFPGVSNPFDTGDGEQNQTMYTVMSYNDIDGPLTPNTVQSWGFVGGPMAYDIGAIQSIYGTVEKANESNVYVLPQTNGEGTYYTSIFDTGGTDTISAAGANSSVRIDLNAATLDADGGSVSKVNGISGGFTIAQGSVIENAVGGNKNDVIIGNSAPNVLQGGGGNDTIYAGAEDVVIGGAGNDLIVWSGGAGTIYGNQGTNTVRFNGRRRYYVVRTVNRRQHIYRIWRKNEPNVVVTLSNIRWLRFTQERRRYKLR